MRDLAAAFLAFLAISTGVQAHEFWIAPNDFRPVSGADLAFQVHVGTQFDGEVFPFQPRAYQAAYWVGPQTARALHTRPLAQGALALSGQGDGLHILAVASFGRRLTHPTIEAFEAFANEVGAGPVLSNFPPVPDENGGLRETYRRFSKTLVNFGTKAGKDQRLGLEYEWVQSGTGFTLFAGDDVAPDHPVDLFCRPPNMGVRQQRLRTDANGQVAVTAANAAQCLISAVFLRPPQAGQGWASDWVSLLWQE